MGFVHKFWGGGYIEPSPFFCQIFLIYLGYLRTLLKFFITLSHNYLYCFILIYSFNMATPKKTSNSSIAVDIETTLRLEAYTKRLGITKKEYIAISLDYFERTGIDPRSNDTQTEWDKLKELIVTNHKEQMDAQQQGFKQQSEKTDTEIKLLADMAIRQDVFQQQQKHQTLLLESAEQRAEQEEQAKAEAKAKKKSWWKF